MPALSIHELTTLLSKLTEHALEENARRKQEGKPMRRFYICPCCAEITADPLVLNRDHGEQKETVH